MFALINLVTFASLAVAPQVRAGDWPNSDLLYTATNPKYHLVCEFHGGRIERKTSPYHTDRIQLVIIRNDLTGEAVTYDPPKGETPPNFSYHDVWSPDGEWLVLSLGSRAGFQLIKASDALAELKRPNPKEFLRLEAPKHKYKYGLFHHFLGWQAPASFNLDVTEDLHTVSVYHFDLESFRLTPTFKGPGVADTYITSKGKQAIHVDPMMTAPHRK